MEKTWLEAYPAGVPAEIDTTAYRSLADLITEGYRQNADKTAYVFMGREISFAQVDAESRTMAAYLQGLGLARGDRVELRGFGAFTAKKRDARTGRNPRTGAAVAVSGKAVPAFKPGKELRERVNGGPLQAREPRA